MKICPKCNCANENDSIICKDCSNLISKVKADSIDYIEAINKKEERKHKFRKRLHMILIPLLGIIYVYLYINSLNYISFIEATFIGVLFPVLAYINIHNPKLLFILRHIFTIDNIDEVELSDFYIVCTKIGGIVLLVIAFVLFTGMVFM